MLAGSGWLPESLRTPGRSALHLASSSEEETAAFSADSVETAADGYETVVVETEPSDEDESALIDPHAIAAR